MLVLDEPTNDLDMETLELLEEILLKFEGTLLLVSHDRAFLDNVITSSIVFEGQGHVNHYVGGYADWIRHGGVFADTNNRKEEKTEKEDKKAIPVRQPQTRPVKLSYKVQRELDLLPEKIELAETNLAELESIISDPSFYNNEQATIDSTMKKMAEAQESLEVLYARWEEIEQSMQQ